MGAEFVSPSRTPSDVPDVLAPGPDGRLLRDQPGPRLRRRRRALRQPAQRLLAAAPRRRLHAAALRAARAVRAARAGHRRHERRLPDDAGLRRPAPRRLRGLGRAARSASRASCARARSASSARRRTAARSASGPSSGLQERRSATSRLFVLPSTSPANAAVPYAERLRWFRALATLDPVERARPRARSCSTGTTGPARPLPCRIRPDVVGDAGRRCRAGETHRADAPPRARRGGRPAPTFELGPCSGRASTCSRGTASIDRQRERIHLVRVDEFEPAPTHDLAAESARASAGGRSRS